LELIAKSQLTSLSGIAQKNFMNILEKVVLKGEHPTHTSALFLGVGIGRWVFSSRSMSLGLKEYKPREVSHGG
jgi:hypothetical protein